MSNSVRPHRRQPTRLPRPWDSPGKNTGVGCHFLLQCMKVKSESEVAQSCLTQRPHGLQPTRLLCPWDCPGKSTGAGCHCLLHLNVYYSVINYCHHVIHLNPRLAFNWKLFVTFDHLHPFTQTSPLALATPILFSVSVSFFHFFFKIPYKSEIIWYLTFSV